MQIVKSCLALCLMVDVADHDNIVCGNQNTVRYQNWNRKALVIQMAFLHKTGMAGDQTFSLILSAKIHYYLVYSSLIASHKTLSQLLKVVDLFQSSDCTKMLTVSHVVNNMKVVARKVCKRYQILSTPYTDIVYGVESTSPLVG